MTFNVRDNLELIHTVASGLPDRDYDPHVDERTERDELDWYYDEHEACFADEIAVSRLRREWMGQ